MWKENGASLEAVERRAYRGFVAAALKRGELEAIARARELFHTRPRRFAADHGGVVVAGRILNRALKLVGRDVACQLFFEEERAYWERHDSSDRVDWTLARRVRLPKLKPSTTSISLRVPVGLLERIKVEANRRDVPYQSLIKIWLAEKVG